MADGVCREMFGFLSVCGCRWKNKAVVPGKEREKGTLADLEGTGGRNCTSQQKVDTFF